MRLPAKIPQRREAIVELGRMCAVSRMVRKPYYAELRSWYTHGSVTTSRARYNKLRAHVRQSTAYLFQSESVRFGMQTPARYGDQFVDELETARDDFHGFWHGSRAGAVVAMGVEWGHVYPTVIFKVVASGGEPHLTLIPDPSDFGVLEEDKPLDRQEAMIHFFSMPLPAFRRLIRGHPAEKELMDLARAEAELGIDVGPLTGTVERLVFDNVGSPLDGGGAMIQRAGGMDPDALVEAPRILCAEVWVVDDNIKDWRVITCIAPGGEVAHTIYDRRTPNLSGQDPFIGLTIAGAPDYCWGLSEVDDLTGLQEWREDTMGKIDRMLDLQLDAPILLSGFGGLSDERAKRLRQPGGTLATPMPGAKAERLAPTMPPEAFAFTEGIDKMFADQGGLPILLQGQGEPGIRAGNQVGILATLASARLRENAMRVEYTTSEIATLMWRLRRELSDDYLMMPNGKRFPLTNLPRETEALVAAHSASPLYAAAIKADADTMLKAGAIDLPTYVELKDPPMVDVLRARARRLAEAKAKHMERVLAIQEMKASHGRGR